MAETSVKFLKGTSETLNTTAMVDGQLLFVTDTGEWYIDEKDANGILTRKGSSVTDVANKLNKHMQVHAPSDAEANKIVGITRNGTALTISDNRIVDINVPTLNDFIVMSATKPNKACMWCKVLRTETT